MNRVILDWPEGMQERIADEVIALTGLPDGTAEDVVDLVAAHLIIAIGEGVIRVGTDDGGESRG